MRLLLDESLPRRLRAHLPGHAVKTVVEMGWRGYKNGRLLAAAAAEFDAFAGRLRYACPPYDAGRPEL